MALNALSLEETLTQELHGVRILDVETSQETNRDGLPVLFLTVHYRSENNAPDAAHVMNALHRLVEARGEDEAYPVLRLIRIDGTPSPSLAAE